MKNVQDDILDGFVLACHSVATRGLLRCSSGNMSCRLDDTRFLATASRSWMDSLSAEEVSLCSIADGSLLQGLKPTVEIGFHAGILRMRKDMNVVLHFQTPCATALACRSVDNINFNVIPEIPFYIGPVARVSYLLPGSTELAEAVTSAMQNHDMVMMSNHGMVTVATDYRHAIQNAEFFELACHAIIHNDNNLSPLPDTEAKRLVELR